MPVEGPDVIPSLLDAAYECVRVGSSVESAGAADPPPTPDGETPPTEEPDVPLLCPEGYVPRRRRRPPYELDGKHIRSTKPGEHNPGAPPDDSDQGPPRR